MRSSPANQYYRSASSIISATASAFLLAHILLACRTTSADVTLDEAAIANPAGEMAMQELAEAGKPSTLRLGRAHFCGRRLDLSEVYQQALDPIKAKPDSNFHNILGSIAIVRMLKGLESGVPDFTFVKAEAELNRIRTTHHETTRSLYLVINMLRTLDNSQSPSIIFATAERGLIKAKSSTREVPHSLQSVIDLLAAMDKGITPMDTFVLAKEKVGSWQNSSDTLGAYAELLGVIFAMCHGTPEDS